MLLTVFSFPWFCIAALCAAITAILPLLLRKKTRDEKRDFLYKLSMGTLAFFLLYKLWLFADPTYETTIFEELPANLCNIALILMPLAVKADSRELMGLLFFECPLGGLMALLTPSEGFYDVPVFLLRNVGYWGTHIMVIVLCLSLVTLGIYRPKLSDIPMSVLILFVLALFNHGFNTALRATVCADSNYFFTYGIEGNPVTELMMEWIPYPFLYLLPAAVPLGLVNLGFYGLAKLGQRKKEKV